MTAVVGKFAAKKVMGKAFDDYKNKEPAGDLDPLYARVPHPRKPGKTVKVKKQIPNYIPEDDAVILARVRERAYSYDMCLFNLFGIRFGWSAVWGMIPVAGDCFDLFLALRIVNRCRSISCGLGHYFLIRMLINVLLDYLVGLIPILGDLGDAAFKANAKNTRLLEQRLDQAYKPKDPRKRGDGRRQESPPPATVYEGFSEDEAAGALPLHDISQPQRPDAVRTTDQHRSGQGRGWLGGRSTRERQYDPEMAQAPPQHGRSHRGR